MRRVTSLDLYFWHIWNLFLEIRFPIKFNLNIKVIFFKFWYCFMLKNWKNQLQKPLLKDGNTNKHVLTKLTLLPVSKYFNFENLKFLLDLSISRNHMIPTCIILIFWAVKMYELQWITHVIRPIHNLRCIRATLLQKSNKKSRWHLRNSRIWPQMAS